MFTKTNKKTKMSLSLYGAVRATELMNYVVLGVFYRLLTGQVMEQQLLVLSAHTSLASPALFRAFYVFVICHSRGCMVKNVGGVVMCFSIAELKRT